MSEPGLVLVVDDDSGTRETLRDVLELKGYTVRTADTGRAALDVLAHSIEAAIVDLKLPDASGLDLLEAIKVSSPATEVILVTGHASLDSALQAIDGAVFAYLTKPFEMSHLVATLERARERHQLARALRESEERYRLVTEHVTDAVFYLDLDGRLVFGNSRAAELTGDRMEELLGTPIFSRLAWEGAREAGAQLDRGRAGQPSVSAFETQLVRKDGSVVWVEAKLTNVLKDGKVIGRLGAARDITERKRAEQALGEANQALTALVADLERRNAEATLLSEMGELLQRCHSFEEAYAVVGRCGQRLFPTEAGFVAVLNPSTTLLDVVVWWGGRPPSERVFAPDQCWALRRGRPHVVDEPEFDLLCKHLEAPPAAGYACLPLVAQGAPTGILHLEGPAGGESPAHRPPDRGREFRPRLATKMAEHVALALGKLGLEAMLRDEVVRDPLTGLFNRRYMTESLEREVHRARRSGTPLGVVMLDVDHFKRLNDRLGHEAGDRVLRALGELLRARTRGQDIACRYGGDEFTLILPGASLDITVRRAEQIRTEFRRLSLPEPAVGPVTLSTGVATFPVHGSVWEDVLRAADAALYRAKKQGRDQVSRAS